MQSARVNVDGASGGGAVAVARSRPGGPFQALSVALDR